jgi:uncharacterized protein (DUF433 family)
MATKSSPFSLRLSRRIYDLVSAEARRTRRSKGAVIESLADEALRCRRFPGIAFRGADWDRRAWVIGTAHDVWEIVAAFQDLGSAEAMVAEGALDERQIRSALAYYEEFAEEVDRAIEENRRSIEDLQAEYRSGVVFESSL